MITVVNRHTHPKCPADFYIGRPSALGNPYRLRQNTDSERGLVVARFAEHALTQMAREGAFRSTIQALAHRHARGEDIHLVCWCAPKYCHGNVIAELVEEEAKKI